MSHRENPIREFDRELDGILKAQPPVSKRKITDIVRLAMKYAKYYKFVVHSVEKFIAKARSEYKVPGLYVIDAIINNSRHKFGSKDMYVARFGQHLSDTFQNLLKCSSDDQNRVRKVINLWVRNGLYPAETFQQMGVAGVAAVVDLGAEGGATPGASGATPLGLASPAGGRTPVADTSFLDDFDYGEGENDAERIAEQKRRRLEEEKRAQQPPPTGQPGAQPAAPLSGLLSLLAQPDQKGVQLLSQLLQQAKAAPVAAAAPAPAPAPTATASPPKRDPRATDPRRPAAAQQPPQQPQQQQQQPPTHPYPQQQPAVSHPPQPPPGQQQRGGGQPAPPGGPQHHRQQAPMPPYGAGGPPAHHRAAPPRPPPQQQYPGHGPVPQQQSQQPPQPPPHTARTNGGPPPLTPVGNGPPPLQKAVQPGWASSDGRPPPGQAAFHQPTGGSGGGPPPLVASGHGGGGPQGPGDRPRRSAVSVLSTTLWVGNIDHGVTQEILQDKFSQFGPVVNIQMNLERRCAFVNMKHRPDAQRALTDLNGSPVMGRGLKIGWGKGMGQKNYKRDWDAQSGLTEIPIDNMSQSNLRLFCDGCVVDRSTCPQQMIADLERLHPDASEYYSTRPGGQQAAADGAAAGLAGAAGRPPSSHLAGGQQQQHQQRFQQHHPDQQRRREFDARPFPGQGRDRGGRHDRQFQQQQQRQQPQSQQPRDGGRWERGRPPHAQQYQQQQHQIPMSAPGQGHPPRPPLPNPSAGTLSDSLAVLRNQAPGVPSSAAATAAMATDPSAASTKRPATEAPAEPAQGRKRRKQRWDQG